LITTFHKLSDQNENGHSHPEHLEEKRQQINGSLPAAPRCLPLQRQERKAFSGFIKAGERA